MPDAAFKVIRPALQNLMGGRTVELVPSGGSTSGRFYFSKPFKLKSKISRIRVSTDGANLTDLEVELLGHFGKAFEVLFNRFESKGYRAHLRTAISASAIDIALARFLRGDRTKAFASIQNLIQVLKRLSFERYEGSPATTGFLIYRLKKETFRKRIEGKKIEWSNLKPVKIDDKFFTGPLTYRYIDGQSIFFVSGVQMNAVATIRLKELTNGDAIDRLSYTHLANLLDISGKSAFGAFLNNSSEVEIVLRERKLIVWRKGVWSIFDPDIFYKFFKNELTKNNINYLIWAAYSLSKTRHGTLVLVGDISKTKIESFKKGSVAGKHALSNELIKKAQNIPLKYLKSSGKLIKILSADGMTIIDSKGNLIDTGVITDISNIDKDEATGGGRTTAAIAASKFGKVIKVSEDGPIDLYEMGERKYRFG